MSILDTKWKELEFLVMPHDAPPIQHQEMRRAFYGGVEALYQIIISPDISEEKLMEINQELKQFAELVQRGGA